MSMLEGSPILSRRWLRARFVKADEARHPLKALQTVGSEILQVPMRFVVSILLAVQNLWMAISYQYRSAISWLWYTFSSNPSCTIHSIWRSLMW